MSARFFGTFALIWVLIAFVSLFWGKADPAFTHYAGILTVLFVGFWSVLRKLDGKAPL